MLQVPSTPQNQLLDQYDDMIQFHDGKKKTKKKRDVDEESLCVMHFHGLQIILLKQLYTLVNTSEGCSQTKQTLWVETTWVVFSLTVGLRLGEKRKSCKRNRTLNTAQSRMLSSTLSTVCCVIKHNISPSHCPDCQGPRAIGPNDFRVIFILKLL